MSGALIQLVAKGAQDVFYMSGEGMSLFTSKYTRHTRQGWLSHTNDV